MPETKKEKEVETNNTPTTPEKKKSNTVLYVVIGVIVFLGILTTVGVLVVRGLLKKGVSELEKVQEGIEQEFEVSEDGEEWKYKMPTEEKVDGKLEKSDQVTDKFPKDIPLPGGIVKASSFDDYSIEVTIDTNSTVEEIMEWFAEELEKEGWEITSRSTEEPMEGWINGTLEFSSEAKDGRRGSISVETNPYQDYSSIRIRELLW